MYRLKQIAAWLVIIGTVALTWMGLSYIYPQPSVPTCYGKVMRLTEKCTEPSNSIPADTSPRSYHQRLDEQRLVHYILQGVFTLGIVVVIGFGVLVFITRERKTDS